MLAGVPFAAQCICTHHRRPRVQMFDQLFQPETPEQRAKREAEAAAEAERLAKEEAEARAKALLMASNCCAEEMPPSMYCFV